jgi:2-polyprenyl-3-methyl-5-hydroxy-6-metoxy-1,4-benzoquinol methylase
MTKPHDSFAFKEVDQEGLETLDAISEAHRFNRWMYETIRPWCKGEILEVGSGIGNISRFFLEEGKQLTLSDLRENYIGYLKEEFSGQPALRAIINLDLVHPDFDQVYADQLGKYDTVFALNVVEHIENDRLALANIRKLLRQGGHCVILVPAYQTLYNRFDKELEHYRRYTKSTLGAAMSDAGYRIAHKQHFNAMGIPGWYISGKLQQNKTIPKGQMSLYNTLVPAFRLVDKVLFNQIGLSVIAVGVKD